MGIRQKLDWHIAELTPNYKKRQAKRAKYDAKYGMCKHGTLKIEQCTGCTGR